MAATCWFEIVKCPKKWMHVWPIWHVSKTWALTFTKCLTLLKGRYWHLDTCLYQTINQPNLNPFWYSSLFSILPQNYRSYRPFQLQNISGSSRSLPIGKKTSKNLIYILFFSPHLFSSSIGLLLFLYSFFGIWLYLYSTTLPPILMFLCSSSFLFFFLGPFLSLVEGIYFYCCLSSLTFIK